MFGSLLIAKSHVDRSTGCAFGGSPGLKRPHIMAGEGTLRFLARFGLLRLARGPTMQGFAVRLRVCRA